jgi:hypothetical protein
MHVSHLPKSHGIPLLQDLCRFEVLAHNIAVWCSAAGPDTQSAVTMMT